MKKNIAEAKKDYENAHRRTVRALKRYGEGPQYAECLKDSQYAFDRLALVTEE